MKIQFKIAAVITAVCLMTTLAVAQTVVMATAPGTIPGKIVSSLPGQRSVNPTTFFDGCATTVGWFTDTTQALAMASIVLVAVDTAGQDAVSVPITKGQGDPTRGHVTFIPRKIEGYNTYKIRVTWKVFVTGDVISTSETAPFSIVGPRKAIALTVRPTGLAIDGAPVYQAVWATAGLPGNADLEITVKPVGVDATAMMIPSSNVGSQLIRLTDVPPGSYEIQVWYRAEAGYACCGSSAYAISF